MAYEQGNILDPKTGKKVIPNTSTSAVADIARSNQALSDTLMNLIERNALGYPAFTTTTAFAVGDIVFYDRKLYKFTSAHAAGAWNASHVTEYSIKEAQGDLIPVDVTRTQTDATFVNGNHDTLFYLRQADSSLAGLMTATEHTKLGELPTASELYTSTIYDVSANNPTAGPNNDGKFTLEYILNQNNVNTLIPTTVRRGGMSIKFVQSSDNKYVQYRLMSTSFSTTVSDWQGVDGTPTANSRNLAESGGVANYVTEKTSFFSNIDLSDYDLIHGWISGDGTYRDNTDSTHYSIPIGQETERISITSRIDKKAYYVFASAILPNTDVWTPLSERVEIPMNTTSVIDVPNSAIYLIVGVSSSGQDNYTPTDISEQVEISQAVKELQQKQIANYPINFAAFPVLNNWITELNYALVGGEHYAIPLNGAKYITQTSQEEQPSVFGFASEINGDDWTRIDNRYLVAANSTMRCSVPENAKYLIVGNRSNTSAQVENYYTPQSLIISCQINELVSAIESNTQELSVAIENGFLSKKRDSLDLNDYTKIGWTVLNTGGQTYTNCPITNESSILFVYDSVNDANYLLQELHALGSKKIFFRRRNTSNVWANWDVLVDYGQNVIIDDVYTRTISSIASQGANEGISLNVMSYNVAYYSNDTTTYLSDDKVYNFRKMLNESTPDIIGLQEDHTYINGENGNKETTGYLFNPILPYSYINGFKFPSIRSRMQAVQMGTLTYTTGRAIEYATYSINNKVLLILSTHPVANYNSTGTDSAETIAARAGQYAELLDWAEGNITLNEYGTTTPVSCPQHDWCIICGDMNTITDTDKTNLTNVVSAKGYTMANGGRLGWLKTALKYTGSMTSLDNIICSPNVIINKVKSYVELYNDLYSDHVPVMANLTLLDT